jgi:ketosteroid isomerase-like protein
MKKLLLLALPALALVPAACGDDDNAATTDDETVAAGTAELRESLNAFDRAFAEGAIEEVSAFFADDAQVLLNNSEAIIGGEAIRAFFGGFLSAFDTSAYEAQYDITDVHGDQAYVLGSFDELLCPRGGGTGTRVHGRIVLFWRAQRDGTWKIERILTGRSAPDQPEVC